LTQNTPCFIVELRFAPVSTILKSGSPSHNLRIYAFKQEFIKHLLFGCQFSPIRVFLLALPFLPSLTRIFANSFLSLAARQAGLQIQRNKYVQNPAEAGFCRMIEGYG
jgi:hypothetical protein